MNRYLVVISILIAGCSQPKNTDPITKDIPADTSEVSGSSVTFGGLHESSVEATHHYTGVIGGKYKFLMNLHFKEDSVVGEYRYFTQKDFLNVGGTYDRASRKFQLREWLYDYDKQQEKYTGYFEGSRSGDTVKGTWFNTDRSKSFDFVLSTDEKAIPGLAFYDNSRIEEQWKTMDTILVSRGDNTQQIITGFESIVWEFVDPINIEDINFDGYLDLMVVESTGARNTPYFYFVYDPESASFIRHDELGATDPVIDVQHKQIVGSWVSGAANYGFEKYVYQNKQYFLVEATEYDLELDTEKTRRYRIVDGKAVEIP